MMEVEWRLARRIPAGLRDDYSSDLQKRGREVRKGKSLNLKRCFLFLEQRLSLMLGFGRRGSRGREEQGGGRQRKGEPGEEVTGGSGRTSFPFLFNVFDFCKIYQKCVMMNDDARNTPDISTQDP